MYGKVTWMATSESANLFTLISFASPFAAAYLPNKYSRVCVCVGGGVYLISITLKKMLCFVNTNKNLIYSIVRGRLFS